MTASEDVDRYDAEKDPDFDVDRFITTIGNPAPDEIDMTGEPLWKRIWYRILRIA